MKPTIWLMLLLAAGIPSVSGEVLPFDPDDTLEEIRYKIYYNGYRFEVADTWVYRLSSGQKARLFPLVSDSAVPARIASPWLVEEELPPSLDWRDAEGKSYVNPIRNQGNCGSCYAFGVVAAAEGSYNLALGFCDEERVDFSESYVMWCLGQLPEYVLDGCDGGVPSDALDALCQVGITYESNYPYTVDDPGTCSYWEYPLVKFRNWSRVECNDVDSIKAAIQAFGSVKASVLATSAFYAYARGVYEDSLTDCQENPCYGVATNHTVALVGWDDQPPEGGGGCWILRNSWGSDWGEGGYMRIRYKSAHVACSACYLESGLVPVPTPLPAVSVPGDYDGDGTADLAVFRPSRAYWQVRGLTGFYFGNSDDTPVPGDYGGDGTWEAAYFRPQKSFWRIRERSSFYFGISLDSPLPGDYDGDGTWEAAFFRVSSGLWKVRAQTAAYYGRSGDFPVPGDYDGNGAWDLAVVRPFRTLSLWKVKDADALYFGLSSDTPVPGDYDGDGTWEAAYHRSSPSFWKIRGLTRFYFGLPGDVPVPGDYNGDGTLEAGCFRAGQNCFWNLRDLSRVYFGKEGDVPVNR